MTESTSPAGRTGKSLWQKLHGEWSWEKYIPGVLGLACIANAISTADGMQGFIRD